MVNYKDIVDSSQLDAATTENPDGTFQDYVAGLKPGTPIIKSWFQTPYYFFRRLIFEGLGVVPNGNIDTMTENQAFNALSSYVNSKVSVQTEDIKESIDNQNIAFNFYRYDFSNLAENNTNDVSFEPKDMVSIKGEYNGTTRDVVVGVNYPFTGTWNAVAKNEDGSIVVAVSNGSIAYSIDKGVNWAQITLLGDWQDVAYSPSLAQFIIVKENAFAVSSDGISWTETVKSGVWSRVACSATTGFIAIADNTDIVQSTKDLVTFAGSGIGGVIKALKCFGDDFFIVQDKDSTSRILENYVFNDFLTWSEIRDLGLILLYPNALTGSDKTRVLIVIEGAGGGDLYFQTTDFDGTDTKYSQTSFTNGDSLQASIIDDNGNYVGYDSSGASYKL